MSYAHKINPMYELCSCMIFSLSCMINVDHGLYHDPYRCVHWPKSKIPTQLVTARYLGRSYPKQGGPFWHLKFGKNCLTVATAEAKDICSPGVVLGNPLLPGAKIKPNWLHIFPTRTYPEGKNQQTSLWDPYWHLYRVIFLNWFLPKCS